MDVLLPTIHAFQTSNYIIQSKELPFKQYEDGTLKSFIATILHCSRFGAS